MRNEGKGGATRRAVTRQSSVSIMIVLLLALGAAAPAAGAAATPPDPDSAPLVITPEAVDLGRLTRHTRGTFRLGVANRTPETIRLIYLHAECDCSFRMPDAAEVPGAGRIELEVEYDMSDAAPGRWDETITILTDHDRLPQITVPVTARVQGWGDTEGNRPDGG